MLANACNTANEEKLVIDLFGVINQPKVLQFEVLNFILILNLILILLVKQNHRETTDIEV